MNTRTLKYLNDIDFFLFLVFSRLYRLINNQEYIIRVTFLNFKCIIGFKSTFYFMFINKIRI